MFEQLWFRGVGISCRRFDDIVSCLHFFDRTRLSYDELFLLRKSNPFFPVDDFIEMLAANYKQYYSLGRMFDIAR